MSSVGVIVGRFQVDLLHHGHIELINHVRKHNATVVVFLGVSPIPVSNRDPLDFLTRKRMLEHHFDDLIILSLPDLRTDEAWSAELDRRIKEMVPRGEVKLYGGRDSFIDHYKGSYETYHITTSNNAENGTDLRADCGRQVLSSADFRAGVIWATQNRFPQAMLCVDVAIMDEGWIYADAPLRLLLARKPGEIQWRFVGGHVDPQRDISIEAAVRREAQEETGLEIGNVDYVSSERINDWRIKGPDAIFSAFYIGWSPGGVAEAHDDVSEVKWFHLAELKITNIVPEHRGLFEALQIHFGLEDNGEPDSANGLVQTDSLAAVPALHYEGLQLS